MKNWLKTLYAEEDGHAITLPGTLITGAGILLVGIGAANGTGWLAVVGGIAGGLGMVIYEFMRHMKIDYAVYARLEALEKKK